MLNRRRTLGLLAGTALAAPHVARAADDIVVGATVPITGPLAGSGLLYYYSLQMAQDDINAGVAAQRPLRADVRAAVREAA